jgi:hypothetical protein
MSEPVICHGCGARVAVPAGHRRRKIQCACGVIVELTDAALAAAGAEPAAPSRPGRAPARSRARDDDEDRWAAELLGAAAPAPEPPATTAPRKKEGPADAADLPGLLPPEPKGERKPKGEMLFECRRCGRLVRRQRECPSCDGPGDAPKGAIPNLSLDEPGDEAGGGPDEGEGSPYDLHGGNDISCPKCTNVLPPGSKFCTRCGYDFRRRTKKKRTYQPIQAGWETDWPLRKRLKVWGVLQVISVMLSLVFNRQVGGDVPGFLLSCLGFAAMTAFLLGTFDRVDLERDTRGRVKLTKTRRLCFFIASLTTTDVVGFEGVLTSRSSEVTGWEWVVFSFLLLMGVLPGLVWWYLVIHKIHFQVALARDHGYAAVIVYRGWSQAQMWEIARTLCDASGLKCDGV